MKTKQFTVRIKAAGTNEGTPDGVFEAIAATYDLDSVGDKILPGAFSETLVDWAKSGDNLPLYWSHRMDDPHMNIGHVVDARETVDGLWVKGQLDLETPTGMQVYRLLKGRRVSQMSFAYDVEDGAFIEPSEGNAYYELRKLKLHEVSVVPIGANQNTEVLAVKNGGGGATVNVTVGAQPQVQYDVGGQWPTGTTTFTNTTGQAIPVQADSPLGKVAAVEVKADAVVATKDDDPDDAKAGRTLSAKNEERVREIAKLAKALLDSLGGDEEKADDSKTGTTEDSTTSTAGSTDAKATTETQPATAEEPVQAKADAPARPGPASLRLLADLDAMCVDI